MFLSLLRGAMVVSKCQAMNKKKSRKPCMPWLAITAIIVSIGTRWDPPPTEEHKGG